MYVVFRSARRSRVNRSTFLRVLDKTNEGAALSGESIILHPRGRLRCLAFNFSVINLAVVVCFGGWVGRGRSQILYLRTQRRGGGVLMDQSRTARAGSSV